MEANEPEHSNCNLTDLEILISRDELLRMHAYAHKKISWWHSKGMLRHMKAEDVVQEAILKTWSGERRWNRDAYKSHLEYFFGCISSIISCAVKKYSDHERCINDNLAAYNSFHDICADILDSVIADETQIKLLNYISIKYPSLQYLAEAMIKKSIYKSEDLSAYLGVNISKVYKDKSRFKTVCKEFMDKE